MKRLLIIPTVALLLAACSGSEGKINKAAEAYGEADARTFIDMAKTMTQMEKESYLLGVKATEWKYMEDGHEKGAHLYRESFERYMKQHCDSLAKEIFD
jgi:hypothetical protein